MKIAIGSDHRGYQAKEKIKAMLVSKGYETLDMGTDSPASFDYPDAAYPTCKAIMNGQADRGILLCGTGIGMCIIANKVQGIRAAPCHDELTAEMSRRHNNANVLCLPADLIGEELIRRIVEVFLKCPFEGGRHERRVKKITEFEMKEHACDHKDGVVAVHKEPSAAHKEHIPAHKDHGRDASALPRE